MHLTRNQAYLYGYRGFESLPLRHFSSENIPRYSVDQAKLKKKLGVPPFSVQNRSGTAAFGNGMSGGIQICG